MRIKETTKALAAVAVLALAGAAAAQDVNSDYDKTFNFAGVKTFSAKVATTWGNPIMEPAVQKEIEDGLVAKGWKKAPEGQADATVLIHGATQQKHEVSTFYSGGYGGYAWRGMGTSTTTAYAYTEGTLVVDIFDAKTKKLVWRGSAKDELKKKQEDREKQLEKAGQKLFKKFPPGSEK